MALMTCPLILDGFVDFVVPVTKTYTKDREGARVEVPADGTPLACSVQPIRDTKPGFIDTLQAMNIKADYVAMFPMDPGLPVNSVVRQTHSNGVKLTRPLSFSAVFVEEPGLQLVWVSYLKLVV